MTPQKLCHGADYNPEQWLDRPDILQRDIELMKQAHVNVVSIGMFSWAMLEPQEGVYNFDWMEHVMDNLCANGIQVNLSTPGGARPPWLAQKYPEVLRVTADRRREIYGMRHNHCYTSPVYRQKVRSINQALAKRFGKHPALLQWHINNEYGGECHCPLCQQAFQAWLRKKYGTLDALNKAWNSIFWSHCYTDWTQIESPSPIGEGAMLGLALDWKRFVSHQTIDFFKWERDCIREILPDAKVTANMMYRFETIDYYKFAAEEDLVSWDNYPVWHKYGVSNEDVALSTAMNHDWMYSLKDKPFWQMESTPTMTNWQPVSKLKKPGMNIQSGLQAVAHGSDAVLYFQWRQSRGAYEKFHGAMVQHDGRADSRGFVECCELGKILEELSDIAGTPKEKQAAIVHDYDNMWALNGSLGPRNCGMGYWDELMLHYTGLAKSGVNVSFVNEDGDLTPYKLVVCPMLYLLREDFAQKIRTYVQNGGFLVLTYWSGVTDEHDLCWLGDTPHGLTDVLGLRRTEIDGMYDGEQVHCINALEDIPGDAPEDASADTLCEIVKLNDTDPAEPLLLYEEDFYTGTPAAAVHVYGKGRAVYLGSRFNKQLYPVLYRHVCQKAGLTPAWETPLPDGVLAVRRGDYVFVQNFLPKLQTLEDRPLPAYSTAIYKNGTYLKTV